MKRIAPMICAAALAAAGLAHAGDDCKVGRYTFGTASGVLKLQTSGGVLPYRRTAAKSFRPLVGERLDEMSCVLNPACKIDKAR